MEVWESFATFVGVILVQHDGESYIFFDLLGSGRDYTDSTEAL